MTVTNSMEPITELRSLRDPGWEDAAIYYAITVGALFSSPGVHPVSRENHQLHAAKIAQRGYVRS